MKCFRLFSGVFLPSLLAVLCLGSCDLFPVSDPTGTIRISFPEPVVSATRASASPLDTNEFELTVLDAEGSIIYKGSYGAAPAEFPVRPGSYTLSVISAAFDAPCFDAPQYGDTQVVVDRKSVV